MPFPLLEKISKELKCFPQLEKIYLNGYDEPTLNPRLSEIVDMLVSHDARIILFTNGTNLTPSLADRLEQTGASIDFDIHLSAVNEFDFRRIHQSKLVARVIDNIQYIADKFRNSSRITVCVSAQVLDCRRDEEAYRELESFIKKMALPIFRWKPNDRAGVLGNVFHAKNHQQGYLGGCSLENRTRDWLHINANGNVLVCCQDYYETHVIGNVANSTLGEILSSELRVRYHDWTTGKENAPPDYICRKCKFVIASERQSI